MFRPQLFVVTLLAVAATASAQSAANHIAKGDAAYAAFHPDSALAQYEAAIAAEPKNVEALWKASLAAITIGEFGGGPNGSRQVSADDLLDTTRMKALNDTLSDTVRTVVFLKGEDYGRRAVAADSTNAKAQFALAYALGNIAMTLDMMAKANYAHEVYGHATTCLKLDPKSAECMHVLGVWHAEAMRVPEDLRQMGIGMLGLKELGTASWDTAARYLKEAVQEQPNRTIHHYDLGRIYVDTKDTAKAKEEFEAALKAPISDFNDPHYKEEAKKALADLSKADPAKKEKKG